MPDEANDILSEHGPYPVETDKWYPQQAWLDALREIAEGPCNAMFNLVAIGIKVPEYASFPPDIDSVIAALHSIGTAYHMNHRGGEIGSYEASVINNHQVDLVCRNPYPDDFDYGLIYGTTRRFCPKNLHFTVYHDNEVPCRKRGSDSCTYHVVFAPR